MGQFCQIFTDVFRLIGVPVLIDKVCTKKNRGENT